MQNEINIQGILCHLCKSENEIKETNETKKVTKIKPYTFFTKNEININNILFFLEHKLNRYVTIKKVSKLKINEISENTIKKAEIHKENEYVMIKYDENEGDYIDGIINFLYNKGEKEYITGVVESYFYIIKTISQLQNEGIIYYNFSSDKMKFKDIYNPHCILYDFELSLIEKKIKTNKNEVIEYFKNFIKINQNFTFKPFEVHVLFYLYKMQEEYLSKYKITQIINKYVENMTNILKEENDCTLRENCDKFMEQFINKNKNDVIIQLINYYKTWDNYSVSILYLHLVENIIQGYKTQMRFMSRFQDILYQNVSQNPNQRMSLEKTISCFNDLFQYWV